MDDETRKRIAEIRAREQKATSGPWAREWYEDGESSEGPHGVHPGSRGEMIESKTIVTRPSEERPDDIEIAESFRTDDAEFIAHARQDVPFLLDALEKAHAEIERLRRGLSDDTCSNCGKLRTTNGQNDTRDGDALCWCPVED